MLSITIIAFTAIVITCRICFTIEKCTFYKENTRVRIKELEYGYGNESEVKNNE